MKPRKDTVAFAIYNKNRKKVLAVLRREDDDSLPNVWGLPAGSLKEDESFEDTVLRAGREKLGVDLKILSCINEGELDRGEYMLHMKEYEVEIVRGEPVVPQ